MATKSMNGRLVAALLVLPLLIASAAFAAPPRAPGNDSMAGAFDISGEQGNQTGSNEGATTESWEDNLLGRTGASVWFRWVAPVTGQVTFDATGADWEPVLAFYTWPNTYEHPVEMTTAWSKPITLNAVAGSTYYVGVDGASGKSGSFWLLWSLEAAGFALNDSNPSVPVGDQNEINTYVPAKLLFFRTCMNQADKLFVWPAIQYDPTDLYRPGADPTLWGKNVPTHADYYDSFGIDVCVPAGSGLRIRLERPDGKLIELAVDARGNPYAPYYRAEYIPTVADPEGYYTFLVDGLPGETTTVRSLSISLQLPSSPYLADIYKQRAVQLYGFKPNEAVRLLVYGRPKPDGMAPLMGWKTYVVDAKGQLYVRIDYQLYADGYGPHFVAKGAVSGNALELLVSLPASPVPTAPGMFDNPTPTPWPTVYIYTPATDTPPPPSAPPGVYVTNIRLDPPYPRVGQDVWFNVTFLNTTGMQQQYRWFVYVYRAGQSKPFGQTSSNKRGDGQDMIPTGTSERVTLNSWKVSGDTACQDYTARVNWYVSEDEPRPEFVDPSRQQFGYNFRVCP